MTKEFVQNEPGVGNVLAQIDQLVETGLQDLGAIEILRGQIDQLADEEEANLVLIANHVLDIPYTEDSKEIYSNLLYPNSDFTYTEKWCELVVNSLDAVGENRQEREGRFRNLKRVYTSWWGLRAPLREDSTSNEQTYAHRWLDYINNVDVHKESRVLDPLLIRTHLRQALLLWECDPELAGAILIHNPVRNAPQFGRLVESDPNFIINTRNLFDRNYLIEGEAFIVNSKTDEVLRWIDLMPRTQLGIDWLENNIARFPSEANARGWEVVKNFRQRNQ